jgi:hypothetical protein
MAYKLLGHMLDFNPEQKKSDFFSFDFWKNTLLNFGKHFVNHKTSVDAEKEIIKSTIK